MSDNVLYIIGNGFDLHHGVDSSYSSFCKWLNKHAPETLDIYETVCDYKAIWSDFETSMAYVNRDYFLGAGELFLPDTKSDPDDRTMADIMLGGDIARSQAENLLDNLKKDFHKWVCTLHAPNDYKQKMLYIDDYARFLTFNYTTFLEDHYGISASQINHIHGVMTQPFGNLVVGHAEDTNKIFETWWKSEGYERPYYNKKGTKYYKRDTIYRMYRGNTQYLPEYEAITESVESYYSDSVKPVKKILSSNADYFNALHDIRTIYVWGFSFSKVDLPYLEKIVSVNKNPATIQWYVSIFTDIDKIKALSALQPLGINTDNIHFKPMAEFIKKIIKIHFLGRDKHV